MPDEALARLNSIAIHASETFCKLHDGAFTYVGLMVSDLRRQGIPTSGVTIDCHYSKKRLLLLLSDDMPGKVCLALGLPETQQGKVLIEMPVEEFTSGYVLRVMGEHFARGPVDSAM